MLPAGELAPVFQLQPVFGLPVQSPSGSEWLGLFFLAGLSGSCAREDLALLSERSRALDKAGVRLVAVSPGPRAIALDLVPRVHLLFPLLLDPDGALRRGFGLETEHGGAPISGLLKGSGRWLRSLARGRGALDRAELLTGAAFLVDPGGRIRWASGPGRVFGPPDVDGLLQAALGLSGTAAR